MGVKKPWQSKTLFLNALAGLILFVSLFVPQASVAGEYLKNHADVVGMVWAGLNMVLRLITKDKIQLGD